MRARSARRCTTSAAQTAFWWAAGTGVTVAPILASFFAVESSSDFWPALAMAAAIGAALGVHAHVNPATRFAQRLSRTPTPMLVAIGYPVSLGVGLWRHNVSSEITLTATLPYLAWVVTLVALGVMCLWAPGWSPESALRAISWFWILMSVLLLPRIGLGLLFVPLAIAYSQATQQVQRTSERSHARFHQGAS